EARRPPARPAPPARPSSPPPPALRAPPPPSAPAKPARHALPPNPPAMRVEHPKVAGVAAPHSPFLDVRGREGWAGDDVGWPGRGGAGWPGGGGSAGGLLTSWSWGYEASAVLAGSCGSAQ